MPQSKESLQRANLKYRTNNRALLAERAAARRAQDPERHKQREADKHLKRKYGLTRDEWWAMLLRQEGRCLGCLKPLHPTSKICVDHDHDSGLVRGLLCDDCNKGLGSCKDDPEILERLAAYVRRHQNGHFPEQHPPREDPTSIPTHNGSRRGRGQGAAAV